jgi:hypothetical protein
MPQSFTAAEGPLSRLNSDAPRKVLVTGAAGNIGSYFAESSHTKYSLRLMVRNTEHVEKLKRFGQVVVAEMSDLEALKHACRDIDTVLHLAADANASAAWESLLPNNIVGAYNVFVAARAAHCRRVIYASSIHAVSGYPADYQVHASDPVNPGDLYGVTKCFGEAMARYMAEQEGLSSICLRIGSFQPHEAARQEGSLDMLDAWVSRRDLNQLIHRCIDTEELRFAILHGLSNNRFKRLDITDARQLVGYAPVDDLTAEHPKLKGLDLEVRDHDQSDPGERSGIRREVHGGAAEDQPPKGERAAR